jgi:uncharacterized phage protein (TIGR02216 family)
MTAGLGVLRLDPKSFWSMTLPELTAALRSLDGPAGVSVAPARADLDALMQRFPDRPSSLRPR